MQSATLASLLIVFLVPLVGLIIGAILPPFLYARQRGLALIANALGLLLYMLPWGGMSFLAAMALGQHDGLEPQLRDPLLTIFLLAALLFFIGMEGLVFLLLWLKRHLATRCQQS